MNASFPSFSSHAPLRCLLRSCCGVRQFSWPLPAPFRTYSVGFSQEHLRLHPRRRSIGQQVDSADELRRIQAARRKHAVVVRARPRGEETAHDRAGTTATLPSVQAAPGAGPAGVVIRLAVPFRSTRRRPADASAGTAAVPATTDLSGALEASYGARPEDVIELVQASMAGTTGGPEYGERRSTPCGSPRNGGGSSSSPMQIVGFSIDVGSACLDDALAGSGAALPRFGHSRPGGPCPAPAATSGTAPGEAVPSKSLAESIDVAVAFAVKMAGVAAEAAAVGTMSRTPPTAAATAAAEASGEEDNQLQAGSGNSAPRPVPMKTAPALGSSSPSPSHPPFSFRRLHVTGLGEGGARGEPLVALKAALSRHLPRTVPATVTAGSDSRAGSLGGASGVALPSRATASKPVVVSADATEHMVAGGAWSTVAAIIGRKSVPSKAAAGGVDVGGSGSSGNNAPPCAGGESGPLFSEHTVERDGGGAAAGGAMYYIDDGCYGSLSGALLRGVQMQPSPLRVVQQQPTPQRKRDSTTTTAVVAAPDESGSGRGNEATSPGGTTAAAVPCAKELPCTVWGPTCDGLDCVCRITQLPGDLEPGRDWLFFADVGIRGGADATDFNGLKPLDLFYCIRRREDSATSSPLARAVSP